MTRPAPVPPELPHGPFARATALGLVSPDELRGPSYRRVLRGVHQRAGLVTYTDRILAARQVLPPGAVLAGPSALWGLGVRLADATTPVEVIVPPGCRARQRPEIRVRRDRLLDDETMHHQILGPMTTPARTAFDTARIGPPLEAVPLLDALAEAAPCADDAVLAIAARHPHTRWLSRVRPALDLVDAGAESVRESRLRVVIIEAGLPRPVTQVVIRTSGGRFVARVDLAWPELRVALEYDGAHHDERGQVVRDRARLNAIRRAGWTVLVVDAAQYARRGEMLALLRSVLTAAAAR